VNGPFHPGEIEAQSRAGVRELATRVGRIIASTIPAAIEEFLAARPFVITATVEKSGAPRASILGGEPGFASVASRSEISIAPTEGHVREVVNDLEANGLLGLLAIHAATRRRIRANGNAQLVGRTIALSVREVYSNCPQYIHPRDDFRVAFAESRASSSLTSAQQAAISSADTFFIASAHPETGADASHRGGPPGFVRADPKKLSWADFSGNNMFNTIGNLLVEPRCGLLFIDFSAGTALRIEGSASIEWEPERTIAVDVKRVIESFPPERKA
jgi:hypothetical protein